jgi:hypothetical protein
MQAAVLAYLNSSVRDHAHTLDQMRAAVGDMWTNFVVIYYFHLFLFVIEISTFLRYKYRPIIIW